MHLSERFANKCLSLFFHEFPKDKKIKKIAGKIRLDLWFDLWMYKHVWYVCRYFVKCHDFLQCHEGMFILNNVLIMIIINFLFLHNHKQKNINKNKHAETYFRLDLHRRRVRGSYGFLSLVFWRDICRCSCSLTCVELCAGVECGQQVVCVWRGNCQAGRAFTDN